MYVVIVGGGRTGSQLARQLIRQSHEVHVIEDRREILVHLHKEIPSEIIHEGSPVNLSVLRHAGVEKADVLSAVTSSDGRNLVVCYIAREIFNVPRTISRVNNPSHAWLFNKTFRVDVTINPAEIISSLISEQMSMGDMMTLAKLQRGDFSLVEEKIPGDSRSIGISIKDLSLRDQCVIAAVIRNDELILPKGSTRLEAGDEILALTNPEGALHLAELLKSVD